MRYSIMYIKSTNMSKYVQKIKLNLKHKMAGLLDLVQLREKNDWNIKILLGLLWINESTKIEN